jgi:cobalt-zinc-cadmium efflux system outer membrane protein
MPRHLARWSLVLALVVNPGARDAPAQDVGGETSLGPAPGSGGSPLGGVPGAGEGILGGRPGPSTPRVPRGITQPSEDAPGRPGGPGIGPVRGVPRAELPLYGSLEIPAGADDEGPADGLTLDAAIERLLRTNLDLRAKAVEIPKAQADILTASLRANPLLYTDTQFIPYGQFTADRPGGPTQYDLNITYPLDLSHKRRARTLVACQAKRVLEAQYQDAVRLAIDALATAFADVLAARETVRYAQASVAGLGQVLQVTRALEGGGAKIPADVRRIKVQVDTAELGRLEAEEALGDARRSLAVLLVLRPAEAESLEVRGTIRDVGPAPPPVETLIPLALAGRPDLVAFRLGVHRARADVQLARANRFEDVFLLYQPYTFQASAPRGSTAWAIGLTVPLPLYDRNQGNIRRARLGVTQTQLQLADLERRAIADVQRAARAYQVTRTAVRRFESDILLDAREGRDTSLRLYTAGEADLIEYLDAQRQYNEVVREYRDVLVRHRRSMAQINTAVGRRILP